MFSHSAAHLNFLLEGRSPQQKANQPFSVGEVHTTTTTTTTTTTATTTITKTSTTATTKEKRFGLVGAVTISPAVLQSKAIQLI